MGSCLGGEAVTQPCVWVQVVSPEVLPVVSLRHSLGCCEKLSRVFAV